MKDLGVMLLDMELKSFISQGIFVPLWLLSIVDCCRYGVHFPRPACIFASSSCVDAVILPIFVEALFIQFSGPFLRELLYI